MGQMSLVPYTDYTQHHEELLKQAADYRLLEQAYKNNRSHKSGISRFLGFLGKEFASLGFSLELRYGGQPESPSVLNQQGNTGGCS